MNIIDKSIANQIQTKEEAAKAINQAKDSIMKRIKELGYERETLTIICAKLLKIVHK